MRAQQHVEQEVGYGSLEAVQDEQRLRRAVAVDADAPVVAPAPVFGSDGLEMQRSPPAGIGERRHVLDDPGDVRREPRRRRARRKQESLPDPVPPLAAPQEGDAELEGAFEHIAVEPGIGVCEPPWSAEGAVEEQLAAVEDGLAACCCNPIQACRAHANSSR